LVYTFVTVGMPPSTPTSPAHEPRPAAVRSAGMMAAKVTV